MVLYVQLSTRFFAHEYHVFTTHAVVAPMTHVEHHVDIVDMYQ